MKVVGGEIMESVRVDDLPEDLARMVAEFANYLRNLQINEKKDPAKNPKPSDSIWTRIK